MSNLTTGIAVMLGIQVMLFLAQIAITEIGGNEDVFYNCKDTIIGSFESQNCQGSSYLLNDTNPASLLPTGETSVNPETGNIFTDAFTGLKSWFLDSTGLSYLVNFLSAPSTLLKSMGLPSSFNFAVSALWYGIMLFLIIAFLFGRDG